MNVGEAKTQLSRLLDAVERGEQVTIARAGKPVVDLVAHRGGSVALGTMAGQIRWDPTTFDDVDLETIEMFEA